MDKTKRQGEGTINYNKPPFPALTAAQRLHFEIYGYVVIEKLLDANEVTRIHDALQNLKRRFEATGNPYSTSYKGCSASGKEYAWAGPRLHFNHLIEADAAFLAYATQPRIVGIAQEVVGCEARLSESQAIINSRHSELDVNNPPAYIFHHQWLRRAAYTEHGLHHFTFVKTLTNLTDIGTGDGGTAVIAGSHKLRVRSEQMVAAAEEDPSLIHHIEAPAGSTLLFAETLLHATGPVLTDRERVVIISGYISRNQNTHLVKVQPEFAAGLSEDIRSLITPSPRQHASEMYRELSEPVGSRTDHPFEPGGFSRIPQDYLKKEAEKGR